MFCVQATFSVVSLDYLRIPDEKVGLRSECRTDQMNSVSPTAGVWANLMWRTIQEQGRE